ncbi:MAG: hypothetical protein ACREN4_04660 [Candidatus Dormibacteria bacterium]
MPLPPRSPDYRVGPIPDLEESAIASDTTSGPTAEEQALEAALLALGAARSARRLLDPAGRLGAAAVVRARPLRGARRASNKAQAAIEESARKLEESRDRWGALAQGLLTDLELSQAEMASRSALATLPGALDNLREALLSLLDAAAAAPRGIPSGLVEEARALLERLPTAG